MKYSEWKKLVNHLNKYRWAEIRVYGIDGWFDCPCKNHLHVICENGKIIEWSPL